MYKRFLLGGARRRARLGRHGRDRRAAGGQGRHRHLPAGSQAAAASARTSRARWTTSTPAARRRSCCSAPTSATSTSRQKNPVRSDTIILLRLDPSKGATAVMSIPRDLKVEHPGPRHRQDQRGLRDRRPDAVGQDDPQPAAHPDQPRGQRQLRRLPPRGRPPRLRLHRRRPPLLQRQQPAVRRRRRLRDDRRQGRLPEALRPGRAGLRPLPPLRHRPRARRAPAAVPVRRQGPDRRRQALQRPQGAAEDLRPLHADRHQRRRTRSCGCSSSRSSRPRSRSRRSSSRATSPATT